MSEFEGSYSSRPIGLLNPVEIEWNNTVCAEAVPASASTLSRRATLLLLTLRRVCYSEREFGPARLRIPGPAGCFAPAVSLPSALEN
jgi:hypothetical protein